MLSRYVVLMQSLESVSFANGDGWKSDVANGSDGSGLR